MACEVEDKIIGLVQVIQIKESEILKQLRVVYDMFTSPFGSPLAALLPPERKFDHAINFKVGMPALWGLIYVLSAKELQVRPEYSDKIVAEGKIQASKLCASSSVLFVPKSNGG